jgi:hypothetical protein
LSERGGVPPPSSKPPEWANRAAQVLPTEHFTLQSARSATISDSSSRASLYLSSVSISLVAYTFIGQASGFGTAFDVFGLVLFPTLFVLGLATFYRVTQSSVEDMLYARGINRIRHFYREFVPEAERYFILSAHDDALGVMRNMAIEPSRWQIFLTTAGTIGIINSVVAGVAVSLAVSLAAPPLAVAVAVGAVAFALSVAGHYRAERAANVRSGGHLAVRFPSPAGADDEVSPAEAAAAATRA